MMEEDFVDLFVYGTLRQGECNDLIRAAARHGLPVPVLLGSARLPGRLVDFGDWPGLLVGDPASGQAPQPSELVYGDVYRLHRRVLPMVDAIEEYDPLAPDRRSCFVRRSTSVLLAGTRHVCQFYPIDPAFGEGRPPIPGGDWTQYRRQRDARRAPPA